MGDRHVTKTHASERGRHVTSLPGVGNHIGQVIGRVFARDSSLDSACSFGLPCLSPQLPPHSGAEGKASATYHQGSLGLDYFLSKRTDVYTIVVYQHASGTDSLGQSAVAQIAGQTPSATDNQAAVRVGIRHRF